MPDKPVSHARILQKSLPMLIVEIVSIFLSVFLAFSLGRWQEKRSDQQTATIALHNIHREIQHNRDEITRVLPVHRELIHRLRSIASREITDRSAFEAFITGLELTNLEVPLVERSAWDAAVASGAVQHMDYETLQAVSSLYNTQRLGLETTIDQLTRSMLQPGMFDPSQATPQLQALAMLLQNMAGNETTLLAQCDSTLARLTDE